MASRIFKIAVIGYRAVGKSTFLLGGYLQNSCRSKTDVFEPIGDDTELSIRKYWRSVQEHGTLEATELGEFKPFDFQWLPGGKLKYGAPKFRWIDYSGEYIDIGSQVSEDEPDERKKLRAALEGSHACCVIIDAKDLCASRNDDGALTKHDAQRIDWLRKMLVTVHADAANHAVRFPVAVVYAKADLIADKSMRNVRRLDQLAKSVVFASRGSACKSKSFLSEVVASKSEDGDGYILSADGAANAMGWLMRRLWRYYDGGLIGRVGLWWKRRREVRATRNNTA